MEIILLLLACIGFVALTNAMDRRRYEPLTSEDFDELVPPGIVSLKIFGRLHAHYGFIYQKPSVNWHAWVASNHAEPPFGEDLACMTVIDPDPHHRRQVTRNEFGVFLPRKELRNDDPNYRMSMIFIRTEHQRYYATLSTTAPNAADDLSTVVVRDEYLLPSYRVLHGVIKPWDPNRIPPTWAMAL